MDKFKTWMSQISDEAKITEIAIPGAHNAGTRGMMPLACCQDGGFYDLFSHGVRHFSIRLNTDKKGVIVQSHAIINGEPFENMLREMARAMEEAPGEFFILEIQKYPNSSFGPYKFRAKLDSKAMDSLMEKYIQPSRYALWDFDDIRNVTMGDIRKTGKRFIILNPGKEYKYSSDAPFVSPWSNERNGQHAVVFAADLPHVYDDYQTEGFFSLQIQTTSGPGTKNGMNTPRRMERDFRPHMEHVCEEIRRNPYYLARTNIMAGDFMSKDFAKCEYIIRLNEDKGLYK